MEKQRKEFVTGELDKPLIKQWESEQELYEAFPVLYGELDRLNFHVPEKWLQIVGEMSEALMNIDWPDGFVVDQVKAKFDFFCFYCHGESDEIKDILNGAAAKANFTCMKCGGQRVKVFQDHGERDFQYNCPKCDEASLKEMAREIVKIIQSPYLEKS